MQPPPVEPQVVVAHYHEVGLKGRNRRLFENRLVDNIRTRLRGTDYARVHAISGRILVRLRPATDPAVINQRLAEVFGLAKFAPAIEAEPTMEALSAAALRLARATSFGSFAVRARRGHSVVTATSQQVNEVVGQAVKDGTGARVDLGNPDWTCHIELVERTAFLYAQEYRGPGGLPAGVSGKVMALMSGGIDSPVAAWELAKRGAAVELVHFHGQPFADPSSARQATRLAEHLAPWFMGTRLWMVPFGEIQAEIVTSAPQDLRVVLYRRFMMRIAEKLALREGAEALVTGESLGQVASQTLPNLLAINDVVEHLPVLRPLIGRDKTEIEALARRVGTYEISIDPHQDCCVLFVPRRVTTHARLPDLAAAEEALEVEALVDKGLANATVVDVRA
ncbi:MAG: tRNA uracil 4-sulfurtransferase ThiI [Actinomycetota bacterium]